MWFQCKDAPDLSLCPARLPLPLHSAQKHYTVFVARVTPEDHAVWRPQLNEEHSAWRWFSLAELGSANVPLHPVVALALHTDPYRAVVLAAVGAA